MIQESEYNQNQTFYVVPSDSFKREAINIIQQQQEALRKSLKKYFQKSQGYYFWKPHVTSSNTIFKATPRLTMHTSAIPSNHTTFRICLTLSTSYNTERSHVIFKKFTIIHEPMTLLKHLKLECHLNTHCVKHLQHLHHHKKF